MRLYSDELSQQWHPVTRWIIAFFQSCVLDWIDPTLHCRRWTGYGLGLGFLSCTEIESRDLSLCNVKCSVHYDIVIEFGIWIRVCTRVSLRQCKWAKKVMFGCYRCSRLPRRSTWRSRRQRPLSTPALPTPTSWPITRQNACALPACQSTGSRAQGRGRHSRARAPPRTTWRSGRTSWASPNQVVN